MKKIFLSRILISIGITVIALSFSWVKLSSNASAEKFLTFGELSSYFPNEYIYTNQIQRSYDNQYYVLLIANYLSMRDSKIIYIDKFGKDIRTIATGDEYRYFSSPSISPNSQNIAYIRVYPFELWVYNIQTQENSLIYAEKDHEKTKDNVLNPTLGFGGKTTLSWKDNETIEFENTKPLIPEIISIDINSKYIERVKEMEFKKSEVIPEMTHYSQRDSEWENEKLGSCDDLTIHSGGCTISTIAMIIDFYGGDTTPKRYNDFATSNFEQGYVDGCLARWNIVPNYNRNIVLKGAYFNEFNPKRIDLELELGNPVILGFDSVSFSNIPHWVVVTAKNGNNYTIYDPWDKSFVSRNLDYYGGRYDHMIVYTSLEQLEI